MPKLNVPEGDKSPTACLACALYRSNPGCESVRRVTLGAGSSRQKLSRPLPVPFHPEVSFIFRGGASHHDLGGPQVTSRGHSRRTPLANPRYQPRGTHSGNRTVQTDRTQRPTHNNKLDVRRDLPVLLHQPATTRQNLLKDDLQMIQVNA